MVKKLGRINCYDVMVAMESPHPGISCLMCDAFQGEDSGQIRATSHDRFAPKR